MPDRTRIQQLLDEMLEKDRTPEEVCASDPELLREIRIRWNRLQLVKHEIDEFFPGEDPAKRDGPRSWSGTFELPRLEGYDVQALLGRGGMGVVFKAYQHNLCRLVAVKTLLAGAYAGPQELTRFRREVEAIAALRHPNIVQIYDAGELDGTPYYTMEFVEGGSLDQKLNQSRLDFRQSAELLAILAVTVQFAHQSGIIHRDLKPANILLTADGTPKITDFGLARFMNAETELTVGGTRLGTPGYMAPEQASGTVDEIGPAVDIYALGAVLYKLLVAQPPFAGETPGERERPVASEGPQSLARLNSKVPRDLETICLKCLKQSPTRRYASAQDLADDLHRFLDGKPIHARPVGPLERGIKLVRRHSAISTLAAVFCVLCAATVAFGAWFHHKEHVRQRDETRRENERQLKQTERENAARDTVSLAIEKGYRFAQDERWDKARLVFANAKAHLADVHFDELPQRLKLAEADVLFAEELVRIREDETIADMESPYTHLGSSAFEQAYAAAFARARFDLDRPEECATRIAASVLREQIVTALELWAYTALMLEKNTLWKKVLKIAWLVEHSEHPENTWTARFRESTCWQDRQALLTLAAEAEQTSKPPAAHQFLILSSLLRNLGDIADESHLLMQAIRRRPSDCWLYLEIARMHNNNGKFADASAYLQIVVALRPEYPWAYLLLGNTRIKEGKKSEGIDCSRAGVELAPENRLLRHFFVFNLILAGRSDEALEEARRASKADPSDAWATFSMGMVHQRQGRDGDAEMMYRKTIELDPRKIVAYCHLGGLLGKMRRLEEAAQVFQRSLELEPKYFYGHLGLGLCYLDLRRFDEAAIELKLAMDRMDLKKILAEVGPDGKMDTKFFKASEAYAAVLIAQSRFAEASTVAKTALTFPNLPVSNRKNLERYLRIGQQLAPLSGKSAALLSGELRPSDAASQCALADWLFLLKTNPVASARLFESGFQQQPELADNLETEYRFHAACSALLASRGISEDAIMLTDEEKAGYRKRALEWLRADLESWNKLHRRSDAAAQAGIAQIVSAWRKNPQLSTVRDGGRWNELSQEERSEWQTLWMNVRIFSATNPALQIQKAGEQIAARQWDPAARNYSQHIKEATKVDDEHWFEFAATQLLSGDRQGYRETCKLMVERNGKPTQIRAYLVARACTLSTDSVEELEQVVQISKYELENCTKEFWSLTEQGALSYRAKQYEKAVTFFEASLHADTRPGSAVLNWLWLAMAHHQLKNDAKAKRYRDRACQWLDEQGNVLPPNAGELGLHHHNWLEAHILRQESEELIAAKKR